MIHKMLWRSLFLVLIVFFLSVQVWFGLLFGVVVVLGYLILLWWMRLLFWLCELIGILLWDINVANMRTIDAAQLNTLNHESSRTDRNQFGTGELETNKQTHQNQPLSVWSHSDGSKEAQSIWHGIATRYILFTFFIHIHKLENMNKPFPMTNKIKCVIAHHLCQMVLLFVIKFTFNGTQLNGHNKT